MGPATGADGAGLGLDGRVVVVTGAGNGLGRSYAHELARRGAIVVVNDLGATTDGHGGDRSVADFVVDEIRRSGGTASPAYDSVGEPDGCDRLVARSIELHGRVDALVHNAGILRNAPIAELTDDRIGPVLNVHLFGALWLTRAVWPTMVAHGFGRMVYTASGTGAWGRREGANYAAAKAGVIGLCNVAAIEGAAHGIAANAVLPVAGTRLAGLPDAADTSAEAEARRVAARQAMPRLEAEWVAPLVAWLASPACDRTRRFYSSVMGRYAEVFVGVNRGWLAGGDRPPSAEELVSHLALIEDRSVFDVPASVFDEVGLIAARVNDRS